MRGAVRPRVLAVAAAAVAGLVALGAIASVAVWGFRNGPGESASGVGGWLLLLWFAVAVAVTMVILIALVGVRALRRPLEDLSRAADQLQVERLPAALREIEAGAEPAPRSPISAPPELKNVAGALENLERFVHYHAKRAQRADRDLGVLLAGAADRAGARARLAEGIDLGPTGLLASGLHRDAGALRALVPEESQPPPTADELPEGHGSSMIAVVAAAAHTTLRPPAIVLGDLEPAIVDAAVTSAIMVVLGEVLDTAIGAEGAVAVHGSVQPEGYHVVIDSTIGLRGAELAEIAEALRDREPGGLPFGLRAGVQAGKQARLLVWLTLADSTAQWHALVPPDLFEPAAAPVTTLPVAARPEGPEPLAAAPDVADAGVPESAVPEPEVIDIREPVVEPESPVEGPPEPAAPAVVPANGSGSPADVERLAAARRLGDDLTAFFARLEAALESQRQHGDAGLDEAERTALVVDGTQLVGRLQEAKLCSSRAQRALLRAVDAAVGVERPEPLTGSARDRVTRALRGARRDPHVHRGGHGRAPVEFAGLRVDISGPLP